MTLTRLPQVSVWTMVGIRFSQIEYYQLGRHTYYAEEWQVRDFKKVGDDMTSQLRLNSADHDNRAFLQSRLPTS